jgi:carbamoyl-phosphate synthase large subunit
MKTFLITAIGSFSSSAILGSLRKYKTNRLVGCDIYPKNWLPIAGKLDVFYQVPKANKKEYISSIVNICEKEQIDFILPLTDIEIDVLSEKASVFDNINTKVCISNRASIMSCRNKRDYPLCFQKEHDINTIPFDLGKDIDRKTIKFPIIVKPINGRSSEGLSFVEDMENLLYHIKYKRNYIFQPYIQGDIVTVDVVRDKLNNVISVPRIELLRTKNGAGITVRTFRDNILTEITKKVVEILDIKGCINIEFIRTKDKYYLMDINPRFSAGIAFSILAGYNFIDNHIRCFEDNKIDTCLNYNEMIVTRQYVELITDVTQGAS